MSNPVARAKALAGSWPGAAILLRLTYWMRKTKIRHGPHMWVVMSRDEWLEETGCTVNEHKNAVGRLKSLDLVVIETHLFRGRTRSFMRLADGVLEHIEAGSGWCLTAPSSWLPGTPTESLPGTPTNKEPTVPKEVKEGDKLVSGEASLAPAKTVSKQGGFEDMKAAEALAHKKAMKVLHKPDSVQQLGFLWKGTVSEVYDTPMVNLSAKSVGQLKHFKNACPEGTAASVLTWVLHNWIEFVKAVETEAGVKTTPSKPDIGFLLKYTSVAVSVADQSKTKPAANALDETPSPGSKSVPNVVASEDDEDQPIKSKEELMAILKKGK